MPANYDLVIFDCDGVIVDSVMAHFEVISRNLAGHGLNLSPLAARDALGSGSMASVGDAARGLGAALPENWVDVIYPEIFERLGEGVDLIPGIVETLDRLDGLVVPYCVASNGSPEKMRLMLAETGILERFGESVFSAHVHGVWKPEPDLYLFAAETMGFAPERCLVVEDSVTGVTAAKRAGMTCLGYAPHDGAEDLAPAGAQVIRDMRQVVDFVAGATLPAA